MRRVVFLMALPACDEALDQRLAIINEPRVLAVISEPAEAKPGATVAYQAIVASPAGPLVVEPSWAFCLASKPPTEDNAVSTGCLDESQLAPLGTAATVTGTLPVDACMRFGPDTPGMNFRPRDPDPTGGYYQPLRVDAGIDLDLAFGFSRITCNLPTAPADIAFEYRQSYAANVNPTLDPVDLLEAPANSDVTLTASWPAESAESYLWFDPLRQRLVLRNESMRVSWFATDGKLAVDASAVAEGSSSTMVTTTWHTPGPGTAHLWFVLRDSRGGVATRSISVEIR